MYRHPPAQGARARIVDVPMYYRDSLRS
eukprot:COSAG02_NODE_62453_length_266_cov_0.526946_1_plen_27_part_01